MGDNLMKAIISIIFCVHTVFITACISSEQDKIKIVANAWIGYSPLFYAKEKGLLDQIGIKLVNVVSLGESLQLYKVGSAQAFTGTQYEYGQAWEKDSSVIPVILFNRSNGGDVVMSNRSIEMLKDSEEEIVVYLETNSINQIVLKDFIKYHGLNHKKLNLVNKDQGDISTLTSGKDSKPTVIVTYVPYDSLLENQGYAEIGSTKDSSSLLVIDALYTAQSVYSSYTERFKSLKIIIDEAIEVLENNPREFFHHVKPYLGNITFDEFSKGVQGVDWLNKSLSNEMNERIRQSGFPTNDLIS